MDERYERAARARDFGSPPDDPACVCRLYTADGLAQVDEVGTVERAAGAATRAPPCWRRPTRPPPRAATRSSCSPTPPTGPSSWYRPLGFSAIGSVYEFLKLPVEPHEAIIGARMMELTPCIVQDARTGEVLTLAYMNDEALERTRETGEMWFWSRSREELWHKGETSGNVQRLRALRYDCDDDAFVALVEPAGPACHTGERTCFYRGDMEPAPAEALRGARAHGRRAARGRPRGELHRRAAGRPRAGSAPRSRRRPRRSRAPRASESDERVAEEAADVLYHLTVLLAARGLSLADAFEVLNERRR